jgi:hypothetical protein
MAHDEPQEVNASRKEGRQNSLVHDPVTGPRPPYDHNAVADAKITVVQPDGHTPVPRWDSRGKHALPKRHREDH